MIKYYRIISLKFLNNNKSILYTRSMLVQHFYTRNSIKNTLEIILQNSVTIELIYLQVHPMKLNEQNSSDKLVMIVVDYCSDPRY